MNYIIFLGLLMASTAFAAPNFLQYMRDEPKLKAKLAYSVDADNNVPNGRITNGNLAEEKQFPYTAGLHLYTTEGAYWCGGTILSDRWVLTAAHCAYNVTTGVDVYLGAWNRSDSSEKGQQMIFVDKRYVIVHENWDDERYLNDIALLKLPAPIEFNEYIQPAKLPLKSSSKDNYEGAKVIAIGWGAMSDLNVYATDKLRWVELPIISNLVCSVWYIGTIKGSHICAKTSQGKSTCNGDSGGPLVLTDGSNTVIGSTSFGFVLGCELGWPSVYTRLNYYLDWIEEHTGMALE